MSVTITVDAHSEDAQKKLKQFFGDLGDGLNKLTGAAHFLEGLGATLAGAFTIHSLVEWTREAINAEETIGRLAQKSGLAIETLSGLSTQAHELGVNFDEFNVSLGIFSDRIYQAARQGGQTAQIFRDIDVQFTNLDGTLRKSDDILADIFERFKKLPDGPLKTAAALDLFGRSGRDLIPVLNQGVEGLRKLQGIGDVTPDAVAKATDFNRALRDLGEQLDKVFRQLAADILPTLQQLVDALRDLTSQTNAVMKSSTGLAELFKGLTTVGLVVVAIFQDLGKILGVDMAMAIDGFKTGIGAIMEVLRDLGRALVDLGKAFSDLITGNFRDISKDAGKALDDITGGIKRLETSFSNAFKNAKEISGDMSLEIGMQWLSVLDFINRMWSGAPMASGAKNVSGGGGGAGGGGGGAKPPLSEEARRLMFDIDKAYSEASKSRIKMFDVEEAELKRKIDQEVHDVKLGEQLKYEVAQTYARKKAEYVASLITSNPRLSDSEKYGALSQLGARGSILGPNPSSFSDQFQIVFAQLKNMNQLAVETAQTFQSAFNNAISSISQGISGLILGTKSWGQAWREIGSAILQNVVGAIMEMGIRWIATKILMATTGQAIDAASLAVTQAIAQGYASTWSTAAALASIASYGGAAAAAPAEIGITLSAVRAMATARERGGTGTAGDLYLTGERGPELYVPRTDGYFFNAAQTRQMLGNSRQTQQPRVELKLYSYTDMGEMQRRLQNEEGEAWVHDVLRRGLYRYQR